MNIYVGNLPPEASEEDLKEAFSSFGQVSKTTIIKDRISGEPRGFGFVEMAVKEEAVAAIDGLNGQNLKGRNLKVSEARPKPERSEGNTGEKRGGFRGGNSY